jgi:hypothetical protein
MADNGGHEILEEKFKALEKKLGQNSVLLSMVIHDMRNPTMSIQYSIKEALGLLKKN